MSDYWDRTNRIIREGRVPRCACGEVKIAADDHGTFQCFTCDVLGGGRRLASGKKAPNFEKVESKD